MGAFIPVREGTRTEAYIQRNCNDLNTRVRCIISYACSRTHSHSHSGNRLSSVPHDPHASDPPHQSDLPIDRPLLLQIQVHNLLSHVSQWRWRWRWRDLQVQVGTRVKCWRVESDPKTCHWWGRPSHQGKSSLQQEQEHSSWPSSRLKGEPEHELQSSDLWPFPRPCPCSCHLDHDKSYQPKVESQPSLLLRDLHPRRVEEVD